MGWCVFVFLDHCAAFAGEFGAGPEGEEEAGFAAGGLAAEFLVVGGDEAAVFGFDAKEFLVFGDFAVPHGGDALEDGLGAVFFAEGADGVVDEVHGEGEVDDQLFEKADAEIFVRGAFHVIQCARHFFPAKREG